MLRFLGKFLCKLLGLPYAGKIVTVKENCPATNHEFPADSKVTIVRVRECGLIQIKDESGRHVWVPRRYLS